MALFKGSGILKLVYPHDGSTDFVAKQDIQGIATSIETSEDGYFLNVDIALHDNTHLISCGECFKNWDTAVAFCKVFSKNLEDIINSDTEEFTAQSVLMLGYSETGN